MFCKSAAAAGVQRIRIFSGAQHLLQARVHFFFFNELAPVGLCDTFSNGGSKAGLFPKQAQGRILHQSLGAGAGMGGDLGKLRLLLWREMDFHAIQGTRKPGVNQL